MQYTRKSAAVEARQYDGPKLVVVSALKGEQTAAKGDYLVTDPAAVAGLRAQERHEGLAAGSLSPKGTIYVIPKAEFEAEFDIAAKSSPPAPAVPAAATAPAVPAAAAGTAID